MYLVFEKDTEPYLSNGVLRACKEGTFIKSRESGKWWFFNLMRKPNPGWSLIEEEKVPANFRLQALLYL